MLSEVRKDGPEVSRWLGSPPTKVASDGKAHEADLSGPKLSKFPATAAPPGRPKQFEGNAQALNVIRRARLGGAFMG